MTKTFWLALGGGAARGLAHIGVIRELERLGLAPVEIAGTSMGAIIAALYALGKTSDQIADIARNTSLVSVLDWDGRKGVIRGDKMLRFFEQITDGKTFEETIVPLKILATDMMSSHKVVFTTGSIAQALRASVSLPWIIRPLELDGRVLIDGGVLNNLPVEELSCEHVIAVSALPSSSVPVISALNILGMEIPKTLLTTSFSLIQNTIQIMLRENERRSLSAPKDIVLLQSDFTGIDMHHFHHVNTIIARGEACAREHLPRWFRLVP